jgi:hypothetical protein
LSTTQASDGTEAPLKPQVLMKLVLVLRRFRDKYGWSSYSTSKDIEVGGGPPRNCTLSMILSQQSKKRRLLRGCLIAFDEVISSYILDPPPTLSVKGLRNF